MEIGSAGYATFTSKKDRFVVSGDGVEVYVVTSTEGDKILLKRVEGSIEGGTGIILKSTTPTTAYIDMADDDDTAADIQTNLLVGVTEETTVDASTDGAFSNYILGNSTDRGVGFYNLTTPTLLPAGKAYLHIDGDSNARQALYMSFGGETTGINEIRTKENGYYYNLQGIRVDNPQHGIYINNGKRMVIK